MRLVFQTARGRVPLRVELAKTPATLRRGLMRRRGLPPGGGMLLVFPRERVQSMWMKDTLIPLDMIFVSSAGRVVGIVENAEPQTLVSRTVGVPSKYVVEVNAGWARRHGIAVGTQMLQG